METVDEFIAAEAPEEKHHMAIDKALSGFSSTTQFLLALAVFYERVEGADPESNKVSAEMITRFAREFAEHEQKTL